MANVKEKALKAKKLGVKHAGESIEFNKTKKRGIVAFHPYKGIQK